jgi:hypothetical protein
MIASSIAGVDPAPSTMLSATSPARSGKSRKGLPSPPSQT